ncbi:hypothetical protein RHECNPAF_1700022 [Rhizobium etli CNPAF512]|nr:hypothetical protein RHECNPAF_1700022 [Rhizobium etli CNPAF512]
MSSASYVRLAVPRSNRCAVPQRGWFDRLARAAMMSVTLERRMSASCPARRLLRTPLPDCGCQSSPPPPRARLNSKQ